MLSTVVGARLPIGGSLDAARKSSVKCAPHPTLPRERGRDEISDDVGELGAGRDAELAEHLNQVVLDRARADEELRRDLLVPQALSAQPSDLGFLRGELRLGLDAPFAIPLSAR